ncbi:uncharacterized protein BT62DRAFT_995015 [Guyanagaster necrorhizus]|uniref:Transmembrane protein n=1 Tax=Guyanagaster necrorhizus TaxID=856835 RepID=A0A9P8ARF3_9AGAR|nr:uncharacterized protein BT62DRAFT_995015 [Guyanagaster necrorhizus MCA 3950]KAG7445025.1 hypothetical protein BT62DRAFT_995015 [Guyanagaster necrorhizus MCA 3950]
MSNALQICRIPSNSDVAGIGVRAATYLQACLALFMSFSSVVYRTVHFSSTLWVGEKRDESMSIIEERAFQVPPTLTEAIKSVESALFITSISVLIGAMIQARSSSGLSPYHALVVLNLAQINSYTAYLLFLCRLTADDPGASGLVFLRLMLRIALRNYVLFAVHSCMMGAFGLWFWGNTSAFLRYASDSASSNDGPCNPVSHYWIFTPVLSDNQVLRIFFLIYYSVSACPPIAFLVPMAMTALIFGAVWVVLYTLAFICIVLFAPVLLVLYLSGIHDIQKWIENKLESLETKFSAMLDFSKVRWGAAVAGSLWLLPINLPVVFYLFATEKMIRMNRPILDDAEAEAQWSYGQTLALITALVTVVFFLRDVGKLVIELQRNSAKFQVVIRPSDKADDDSIGLRRCRTV